jgi:hypothetical protein
MASIGTTSTAEILLMRQNDAADSFAGAGPRPAEPSRRLQNARAHASTLALKGVQEHAHVQLSK